MAKRISNKELEIFENKIARYVMGIQTLYILAQVHRHEPELLLRILELMKWINIEKEAVISEMHAAKEKAAINQLLGVEED